jgi:hypothetical protein
MSPTSPTSVNLSDPAQVAQALNSFHAELQALRAQFQGLTSPQAIPNPPPVKETKIRFPHPFDGTRSTLRGFLNQLTLIFVINSSTYDTDIIRIGLAGSLLTGDALRWFSPLLEATPSVLTRTWADFKGLLETSFPDVERTASATTSIRALRQGNGTVATYSAAFSLLRSDLAWNDAALIAQFRSGLSAGIKDLLLHHPTPTSLAEQIALALKCCNRLAEHRAEMNSIPLRNPARTVAPPHARTTNPAPALTFIPPALAASDSMDIDAAALAAAAVPAPLTGPRPTLSQAEKDARRAAGLCLYCGLAGHIVAVCPRKPAPFPRGQ